MRATVKEIHSAMKKEIKMWPCDKHPLLIAFFFCLLMRIQGRLEEFGLSSRPDTPAIDYEI